MKSYAFNVCVSGQSVKSQGNPRNALSCFRFSFNEYSYARDAHHDKFVTFAICNNHRPIKPFPLFALSRDINKRDVRRSATFGQAQWQQVILKVGNIEFTHNLYLKYVWEM